MVMNKPCFFKVREFYINVNDITSITAHCPDDFSNNTKTRDVENIRAAVGREITDRYFKYYSSDGGGYSYIYRSKGGEDIFVYKVSFANDNRPIYISPANFEKLSKLLEISDIG